MTIAPLFVNDISWSSVISTLCNQIITFVMNLQFYCSFWVIGRFYAGEETIYLSIFTISFWWWLDVHTTLVGLQRCINIKPSWLLHMNGVPALAQHWGSFESPSPICGLLPAIHSTIYMSFPLIGHIYDRVQRAFDMAKLTENLTGH